MTKIVIRLSAHLRIGLGHAVRMGALVEALTRYPQFRDQENEYVIVGEGDLWRPYFPAHFSHLVWPDDRPLDDLELNCDLWLHDHPLRPFKRPKGAQHVVVIDDYGGDVDGDLIANGSVLAAKMAYVKEPQKRLLGAKYALMRPQWSSANWGGTNSNSIVVILGSGPEAAHFGYEWAQILGANHLDLTFDFVIGGGFFDTEALRAKLSPRMKLHQALSPEALTALLSKARLCITTGGMIAYEVITMGVPALIMPQLEDLRDEIGFFARINACYDLSQYHQKEWPRVFMQFLNDPKGLSEMSKSQKSALDGQGIRRVCDAVISLIKA